MKLQAFYSIYFYGKNHFEEDGTQNYLVFQLIYRFFRRIGNTDHISARKSKGLSDLSIKPCAISDTSLVPSLNHIDFRARRKLDGQCLKKDKLTFNHKNVVDAYIVYEIYGHYNRMLILINTLFRDIKLTKNTDFD